MFPELVNIIRSGTEDEPAKELVSDNVGEIDFELSVKPSETKNDEAEVILAALTGSVGPKLPNSRALNSSAFVKILIIFLKLFIPTLPVTL